MTDTEQLLASRRVSVLWPILIVLVAAFVLVHDSTRWFMPLTGHLAYTTTGAAFSDYCEGDGYCRLRAVEPGSSMAATGAQAGDTVRFDRPWDYSRPLQVGETVGFTLRHNGQASHHEVTGAPRHVGGIGNSLAGTLLSIACILSVIVGLVLTLRSGRRLSALLLGAAYVCIGLTGSYPTLLESFAPVFPFTQILLNTIMPAAAVLLLAFAITFRRETTGRVIPFWYGFLAVYTALTLGSNGYELWCQFAATTLPIGGLFAATVAIQDVGLLFAAVILALGARESSGQTRTRYAFMIVAVALTSGLQVFGTAINLTGNDWSLSNPLVIADVVCPVAGALIFAYALLRHRVIDLGFAVNQTLVYGVVSFVVLLLFGLAEWGIEKILPHEWHEHLETNAFISAALALGIFLVFHRIRDVVEHVIEGLFFHAWRKNEAQLDRFVKQAAHILKPDALKAAAVAEFVRFSGGAEVALYHAEGTQMVRDAGSLDGLGAIVDADAPALVEMRAEGKPLFDDGARGLHAALVLPMIQRNDLTGFVVLGAKPSGDAYRPDERALLADAAQKIGLDLHALRIEELEAEARHQRQRADVLEAQVQQGLRGSVPA